MTLSTWTHHSWAGCTHKVEVCTLAALIQQHTIDKCIQNADVWSAAADGVVHDKCFGTRKSIFWTHRSLLGCTRKVEVCM